MTIDREALKAIKPVYRLYCFSRFLLFQSQLRVAEFRDRRARSDPSSIPIPPAKLRYRVHGSLDAASYLQAGNVLAQNIRELCDIAGRDFCSFRQVLDFGCGSARVLRNFRSDPASCQLHGTDIDPELVDWCAKHLPGIRWSTNGPQPPLPFPDETFDLIYAISVFSHLDETLQHAWLRELRRVARPGATIILTAHGEHCIRLLSPSLQSRVHSRGFLFVTGATGRLKLDGLPDFYQSAFHTQEYIEREWSAYFDIVRYQERGINNHQDAVVMRKP